MVILLRVAAVAIGYVIGMFQTGYIYGKRKGIDIRQHGSGNSGTTNTIRTLGWKAGAVTFAGDLLKAMLSVVIVYFAFRGICPQGIRVLGMYAGFGAVLGHNFPFYLKFKGGKGIACTAGVVLAVCPLAAPICLVVFTATVLITRYVSLGSLVVVTAYLIQAIVFNHLGYLDISPEYTIEFDVLSACFWAMAFIRHRTNIKRLLNGTENKFGQKAE